MKASTVLVAVFAAGAMARAIPDEKVITLPTVGPTVPEGDDYKNTEEYKNSDAYKQTDEYKNSDAYKQTDEYKKEHSDSYKDNSKSTDSYKDNSKSTDSYKDNSKSTDSYKDNSSYEVKYPKKDENTYVSKSSYEQNKDTKHYGPTPYENDESAYKKYESNSCFEDFKWKKDVYADDDCEVEYKPKPTYKGKKTVVYVYGSDDYSKPIEKCGEDDSNSGKIHWKPTKSWIPSDCKDKGRMYRFKVCDADNEDSYTWSSEFPVYNPYYYASQPEAKPEPAKCPPPACPVYPVTPVPVQTPSANPPAVTPVAPAPPAKDESPVDSYPTTPAAPVAPAPEAPAEVAAPTNATSEDVAPFTSGSSAVKTSISFMVGIAALVTFAL